MKKAVQLPSKVGGGIYATKAERDAANREGAIFVLTPLVAIIIIIVFLGFADFKMLDVPKTSAAAADATEAVAAPPPVSHNSLASRNGKDEEALALLLNLNSLLCAKVVEVNPLKVRPGVLEVKCIEYRGGTATKNYIVNTNNGTAFPQ